MSVTSSPLTTKRLLGNGLAGSLEGIVNNSITRPKPWDVPVPVHNPNTSYGLSYNADYGKSVRIKEIGRQILEKSDVSYETKSQAIKIHTKVKPFLKIADNISDSVNHYGRKISPIQLNSRLEIREDMFDGVIAPRSHSPKVSSLNMEWLKTQGKRQECDKFLRGEFIPNMNQLQLYGRRAEKSRFEQKGLWIINKSFM